jgi:hypothetical protein
MLSVILPITIPNKSINYWNNVPDDSCNLLRIPYLHIIINLGFRLQRMVISSASPKENERIPV